MIWFKKSAKPVVLSLATLALAVVPGLAQDRKVAIASLGPHPVLQMVVDGFKAGLASGGFEEGSGGRVCLPGFQLRPVAGRAIAYRAGSDESGSAAHRDDTDHLTRVYRVQDGLQDRSIGFWPRLFQNYVAVNVLYPDVHRGVVPRATVVGCAT